MVSFAVQKLLNLMESHLFIFTFCYLCFWCQGAKKQRSFTVLGLMSKSLMLFEFVFGVRSGSCFIPLHEAVQFSQHHLWTLFLSPLCVLGLFVVN